MLTDRPRTPATADLAVDNEQFTKLAAYGAASHLRAETLLVIAHRSRANQCRTKAERRVQKFEPRITGHFPRHLSNVVRPLWGADWAHALPGCNPELGKKCIVSPL